MDKKLRQTSSLGDAHMTTKKPALPTSTPSPGVNGRANPYSTTIEPHFRQSEHSKIKKLEPLLTSTYGNTVEKVVQRLPFEIREEVFSVMNMTVLNLDVYKKQAEAANNELAQLKINYRSKLSEIEMLNRKCELYRDQVGILQEKLGALQDDAESRSNYAMRNAKAISRLSSTNRTLMDAFELIADPQAKKTNQGSRNDRSRKRQNIIGNNDMSGHGRTNSPPIALSAISETNQRPATNSLPPTPTANANVKAEEVEGVTSVQRNEKLRGRLLKMAIEHNRVVKTVESLELKIQELRSTLKYTEKRNRQMQLELDELRESHSLASGESNKVASHLNNADKEEADEYQAKSIERMDIRLNTLLNRNAFDPMEGIRVMRNILAHLAKTPSNLIEEDVASHLCNKLLCKLFDVELIAVFLLQPGGTVIHKYTTKGHKREIVQVGSQTSLVDNVLRTGTVRRYNNLKRQKNMYFNPYIDGDESIAPKRIIAVPLRENSSNKVIGVLTLINRQNNVKFTEVDELFAEAFGDLAGGIVSSCLLYKRLCSRAEVLTSILQSSLSLWNAFPEPNTLATHKPLQISEVLFALENCVRDGLRCSNVKGFLVSEFIQLEDGSLLSLEQSATKMKTMKSSLLSLKSTPQHSGVAGLVVNSRKAYCVDNAGSDAIYNPQVDLDPHNDSMVCVPIFNYHGEVIACIQLVRSMFSPAMSFECDNELCEISFETSCEWVSYQLSGLLSYALSCIGQQCCKALITPPPLISTKKVITEAMEMIPAAAEPKRKKRFTHFARAVSLPDEALEYHSSVQKPLASEDDYLFGIMKQTTSTQGSTNAVRLSKQLKPEPRQDIKPFATNSPENEDSPSQHQKDEQHVTDIDNQTYGIVMSSKEKESSIEDILPDYEAVEESDPNVVIRAQSEIDSLGTTTLEIEEVNKEQLQTFDFTSKIVDDDGTGSGMLSAENAAATAASFVTEDSNTVDKQDLLLNEEGLNYQLPAYGDEAITKALFPLDDIFAVDDTASTVEVKTETIVDDSHQAVLLDKVKHDSEYPIIPDNNEVLMLNDEVQPKNEASDHETKEQADNGQYLLEPEEGVCTFPIDVTTTTQPFIPPIPAKEDNDLPSQEVIVDDHQLPADEKYAESPSKDDERKMSEIGDDVQIPAVDVKNIPQLSVPPTPTRVDSERKFPESVPLSAVESKCAPRRSVPPTPPKSANSDPLPGELKNATQRSIPPTPTKLDSGRHVASSENLFGDWIQVAQDNGEHYYYNNVTGESSWTLPEEVHDSNVNVDSYVHNEVRNGDWVQLQDDNGNFYWYNVVNGESAWQLPDMEAEESHGLDESQKSAMSAGGYTIEL